MRSTTPQQRENGRDGLGVPEGRREKPRGPGPVIRSPLAQGPRGER